MERQSIAAIVRALNEAGVRYLVAGGLAVVAHGHVRFTADLDLLIDLEADNAGRAVAALSALGYRSRAPVPLASFADPAQRASWVRDRHMTVFSLYSPKHPATEIDLFVESPIEFGRAYQARVSMEVASGVAATFVSLNDLLDMKRLADRPQDKLDVDALTRVREDSGR
jgi:hypothetical protein